MKLKTFNATNVVMVRSFTPGIGVNSKSGLFTINRAACDEIGLKEGDFIQFLQDEEEPENWFIEKVKDTGFQLRGKGDEKSALSFNNTTMVRKIFDSVAYVKEAGRLLLGEPVKFEKRTLRTLITLCLKND